MKNILSSASLLFSALFFLQTVSFAQWIPLNEPAYQVPIYDLTVSDTNLFAVCGNGVYLSTDNGTSWSTVFSLENYSVYSLITSGSDLFIGTFNNQQYPDGGVFHLTSNDSNWINASSDLPKKTIRALAVSDTNLFAGGDGGAFLSTNNGTNWTPINNGLTSSIVQTLAVSGKNLFAGCEHGIYLSTNNGTSWSEVDDGLTSFFVFSLFVSDTNIYAGTRYGGVFLSTNNGNFWNEINSGMPVNVSVYDFAAYGQNLFAASDSGVFRLTNNDSSWTNVSDGLPEPINNSSRLVYSLAVCGTDLFAGTAIHEVYRRPLSELITSVEQISYQVPENYNLLQNYPNPFNPSTTIKYDLPRQSRVKLVVYNVLGREVATLVDGAKKAGSYQVRWNAKGFASGVYFYRLKAGDYIATKKLLLLK